MPRDGNVTGDYYGKRIYHDRCQFNQGVVGMVGKGDIFYVDAGKSTGVTGDGSSWDAAFLTILEAVNAVDKEDSVILVRAGTYTEATALTLTSTHNGLKLIGTNNTTGFEPVYLASPTASGHTIVVYGADNVEIANLAFYITTNGKYAIVGGVSGDATSSFGLHIHDCYYYGASGGGEGFFSELVNPDCPDLLIERCKIQGADTAAIKLFATRGEVRDCNIKPLAGAIGIDFKTRSGFETIRGNVISGVNSTDTGIKIDSGSTAAGCVVICDNTVLNCGTIGITQDVGITNIACNNWVEATNGAFAGMDTTNA